MVQDAEEHAAEDEAKRQVVKIRNEAEILVYSTEQTLQEHADKIDESDREGIIASLEKLKELLKDTNADHDEVRKASESLSAAVYRIAELMYNTTSGDGFTGE
jgi:molecular chaperone DnaK